MSNADVLGPGPAPMQPRSMPRFEQCAEGEYVLTKTQVTQILACLRRKRLPAQTRLFNVWEQDLDVLWSRTAQYVPRGFYPAYWGKEFIDQYFRNLVELNSAALRVPRMEATLFGTHEEALTFLFLRHNGVTMIPVWVHNKA